jgi:hypothetical protein
LAPSAASNHQIPGFRILVLRAIGLEVLLHLLGRGLHFLLELVLRQLHILELDLVVLLVVFLLDFGGRHDGTLDGHLAQLADQHGALQVRFELVDGHALLPQHGGVDVFADELAVLETGWESSAEGSPPRPGPKPRGRALRASYSMARSLTISRSSAAHSWE